LRWLEREQANLAFGQSFKLVLRIENAAIVNS